jgi:L-methionine (R)-S-oxide reductase
MSAELNPATADLQVSLELILSQFRADSGTIHLLAEDGLLHLRAISGAIPEGVKAVIRAIPVGKGMAGLAVQRGKIVDACNIQIDNTGDVQSRARATGLQGAIVVPIFDKGRAVGALGVASRAERVFTNEEKQALLSAAQALVAADLGHVRK